MGKKLLFGGREYKPDIRMLDDTRDVLYDRGWSDRTPNIELYFMYRDLALNEKDRELIRKNHLRYDITVIPPFNLGREYVKTTGHYHPKVPGTSLSYTEVYQVLSGRAHYLLQKMEKDSVEDVVLVEAEVMDVVVIPPNYGHVTINPADETLKMANWVSRDFKSVYETIHSHGGAAYFELVGGKFTENPRYDSLPELRYIKPQDSSRLGLDEGENMYKLIHDAGKLELLNRPQEYGRLLGSITK